MGDRIEQLRKSDEWSRLVAASEENTPQRIRPCPLCSRLQAKNERLRAALVTMCALNFATFEEAKTAMTIRDVALNPPTETETTP